MSSSLLFIPDISGFTEFVNRTEVAHSQHVIAELLELIIDSDRLGMTVSEIEGDAVFFYKEGAVPPLEALVQQAQDLFEAFHTRLKDFESLRICDCGACRTAHTLSLKVVAHSGPIEFLKVRGFQKPFGSDVILAHRLLKNDLDNHEYLLVTESMLGSQGWDPKDPIPSGASPDWSEWCGGTSNYEEYGAVPYRYLPLGPLLGGIPDPVLPPAYSKMDNPIQGEVLVERPMPEVFELISNFDLRLTWNSSVDDLHYDADRINRVGTKHHCVIGGDLIEFETVTDDFGEGRMAYGERLLNPPLVADCAAYYVVEPEGEGTRLRMEVHYQPRSFPRSLLAPLFRFGFRRRLPKVLRAIKEAAEARLDER